MLIVKPALEVPLIDRTTVSSTVDRLPANSYSSLTSPNISKKSRVAGKVRNPSCDRERFTGEKIKIRLDDDHVLIQVQEDKRNKRTNEFGLTVRQMEVLQQLAIGLSNKEIGLTIGLAEGTVKIHVATIFHALRVNKRMDAVQVARRLGLLAQNNPNSNIHVNPHAARHE